MLEGRKLEPKRLNERYIKLQQKNKKMLMENDILNIETLIIDKNWDFELDNKYIKTKKIVGKVLLYLKHIPSWMKGIEIDGSFDCAECNLTSLKNCPKIITKSFYCSNNNLSTLEDGPTYVGANYFCWRTGFTEEYVRSICNVKAYIFV